MPASLQSLPNELLLLVIQLCLPPEPLNLDAAQRRHDALLAISFVNKHLRNSAKPHLRATVIIRSTVEAKMALPMVRHACVAGVFEWISLPMGEASPFRRLRTLRVVDCTLNIALSFPLGTFALTHLALVGSIRETHSMGEFLSPRNMPALRYLRISEGADRSVLLWTGRLLDQLAAFQVGSGNFSSWNQFYRRYARGLIAECGSALDKTLFELAPLTFMEPERDKMRYLIFTDRSNAITTSDLSGFSTQLTSLDAIFLPRKYQHTSGTLLRDTSADKLLDAVGATEAEVVWIKDLETDFVPRQAASPPEHPRRHPSPGELVARLPKKLREQVETVVFHISTAPLDDIDPYDEDDVPDLLVGSEALNALAALPKVKHARFYDFGDLKTEHMTWQTHLDFDLSAKSPFHKLESLYFSDCAFYFPNHEGPVSFRLTRLAFVGQIHLRSDGVEALLTPQAFPLLQSLRLTRFRRHISMGLRLPWLPVADFRQLPKLVSQTNLVQADASCGPDYLPSATADKCRLLYHPGYSMARNRPGGGAEPSVQFIRLDAVSLVNAPYLLDRLPQLHDLRAAFIDRAIHPDTIKPEMRDLALALLNAVIQTPAEIIWTGSDKHALILPEFERYIRERQ
ncbi:hypothetical protein JCM10296v2_003175 [Rhodotorula toruloides]